MVQGREGGNLPGAVDQTAETKTEQGPIASSVSVTTDTNREEQAALEGEQAGRVIEASGGNPPSSLR